MSEGKSGQAPTITLQEIGLFDRPHIVTPSPANKNNEREAKHLKIGHEAYPKNRSVVMNPNTIWRLCRADSFLQADENQQNTVLNVLVEALQLEANNCHILGDYLSQQHASTLRQNKQLIAHLRKGTLPDF